MTEQASDADKSPKPLPEHVREIRSDHGTAVMSGSPRGAQVWRGRIHGRDIIRPLEQAHSIVTDWRPESTNSYEEGETGKPGGSFPSFGGGVITLSDGSERRTPVHGPYSSAGYLHELIEQPDGREDVLAMHGKPDRRTEPFFPDGQRFGMVREMRVDGDELILATTITNLSGTTVTPPEFVEHTYLEGGKHAIRGTQAAILGPNGPILPESLPRTAKPNGNAIDTRIGIEVTGTAGECVFLPLGEDGHVVVMSAHITGPDRTTTPVTSFYVYRYEDNDPKNEDPAKNDWTGIEPIADGIPLGDGQSFTMTVSIRTFESVAEYQAHLAAQAAQAEQAQ